MSRTCQADGEVLAAARELDGSDSFELHLLRGFVGRPVAVAELPPRAGPADCILREMHRVQTGWKGGKKVT